MRYARYNGVEATQPAKRSLRERQDKN